MAGSISGMDRLVEWLRANLPADRGEVRVVHGDYVCDNMIFAPGTQPRVLAVLDWKLSTLGDKIADFLYHFMMYRMPDELFTGFAGLDSLRSACRPNRNTSLLIAAETAETTCQTSIFQWSS